jgi:hypothetical protein
VQFEQAFPAATFTATLSPGDINAWVRESLEKAQGNAYPKTLKRNQRPNNAYATRTFKVSQRAIAESGYRLADLLNQLFES